jgi:hypothetical protein
MTEKTDKNGVATSDYISTLENLIDVYEIEDGYLKLLTKDY